MNIKDIENLSDFTIKRESYLSGKPENVREWCLAAIKKETPVASCYRIFSDHFDLETDLSDSIPYFITLENKEERSYELRLMWRFLHRRYAFGAASRVNKALSQHETLSWRLHRYKDWLRLRLLISIGAGFILVYSSSGLFGFLKAIDGRPEQILLAIALTSIHFALCFQEVQKQIGRPKAGILPVRATILAVIGISYGFLGATIQYGIGQHLGWIKCASLGVDHTGKALTEVGSCYAHSFPIAISCALAAVTLGNIFQLFWQDRSVGDPL